MFKFSVQEGRFVGWLFEYCDTTSGNWWTTVNTNLNLNSRDVGLLAANPDLRVV